MLEISPVPIMGCRWDMGRIKAEQTRGVHVEACGDGDMECMLGRENGPKQGPDEQGQHRNTDRHEHDQSWEYLRFDLASLDLSSSWHRLHNREHFLWRRFPRRRRFLGTHFGVNPHSLTVARGAAVAPRVRAREGWEGGGGRVLNPSRPSYTLVRRFRAQLGDETQKLGR